MYSLDVTVKKISSFFKSYKLSITLVFYLFFMIVLFSKYNIFQPFKGPPYEIPLNNFVTILVIASLIGYFLYVSSSSVEKENRTFIYMLIGFILLLSFFIKPLFSQDIYKNMLLSKNYILAGNNPYITVPENIDSESFLNSMIYGWRDKPFTHGPISIIFFGFPYFFTSNDLVALLFLRLVVVLSILMTLFILRKQLGMFSQLNILLSPIVIFNGVIELHNDILVMLLHLLAYYFLLRKKVFPSVIMIIFAVFTKYISLIICPTIFLIFLLGARNNKDTLLRTLKIFLVILTPLILTAWLFFDVGFFNGFNYQLHTYSINTMTPLALLITLLVPNEAVSLFIGFLVSMLVGLFVYKRKDSLGLFIYPYLTLLLLFMRWVMGWYFLWVLPFVIIMRNKDLVVLLNLFFLSTYGFPSLFLSILYINYLLIRLFVRFLVRHLTPQPS